MTAAEFNARVIRCHKAYAMTMPGLCLPITRSAALCWLNDAFDASTYKPVVRFIATPQGEAVVVGFCDGQGTEVTP